MLVPHRLEAVEQFYCAQTCLGSIDWLDACRHLNGMNTQPYPSDLTNDEWTILAPLITPGKQAGHPQVLELRRIVWRE